MRGTTLFRVPFNPAMLSRAGLEVREIGRTYFSSIVIIIGPSKKHVYLAHSMTVCRR